MYSGPSQPMLRPDGADLFIRRELATCGFGKRSIEFGGLFKRKFIGRLIQTCELQEDPREIVLSLIGQGGYGFDSLFEQAGHVANIVVSAPQTKPCGRRRSPPSHPLTAMCAAWLALLPPGFLQGRCLPAGPRRNPTEDR